MRESRILFDSKSSCKQDDNLSNRLRGGCLLQGLVIGHCSFEIPLTELREHQHLVKILQLVCRLFIGSRTSWPPKSSTYQEFPTLLELISPLKVKVAECICTPAFPLAWSFITRKYFVISSNLSDMSGTNLPLIL